MIAKISPQWTTEERIKIVSALLTSIQDDIYAGRYSEIGSPNITTLQVILNEKPAVLESMRSSIESFLESVLLADMLDTGSKTADPETSDPEAVDPEISDPLP